MIQIEKWGIFEATLKGKFEGNPFTDYCIMGKFESKSECKTVDGFYDGDGNYIVRFMPSFEEDYTYKIFGSFSEQEATGKFSVTPATKDNHGPVRVANTYHFAYEDGTPHYSVGTTAYAWIHQSVEMQKQTLNTLAKGYFNKVRFCVFPKHYDYNFEDPITFPYEGTPMDCSQINKENFFQFMFEIPEGNDWDFTRFNPQHFRNVEKNILELMKLGIEADIIVMHPYDRWGFSKMTKEQDHLYWNYVLARFSAYRNVWWSLANEYDLLVNKTIEDWEEYAIIICQKDPYNHLRSIHNCNAFYDYHRPWITHCSMQRQDLFQHVDKTDEFRTRFGKPIIWDEIAYEGDVQHCWGNISAKELVKRFWDATVRGGYAGHGETYLADKLWWSHGGELKGESQDRIKFMHEVLKSAPGIGLKSIKPFWDEVAAVPENDMMGTTYRLYYYGIFRPRFRDIKFPNPTATYTVDVIDTWNMTITNIGNFTEKARISLPGTEYIAIRIIMHEM